MQEIHIYYMPTVRQTASRDVRWLAQQGFLELTGQKAPEIEKQPGGKPHFPGNLLYVSLCHTDHMALCALSAQAVGLDAEQPRPVKQRMMQRCLGPEELACCQAAPQPETLFLRFWTLKEAYAKYTGEGICGFPNHLRFRLDGQRAYLAQSDLVFQSLQLDDLTVSVCSAALQKIVLHPQQARPEDRELENP